MNHWDQLFVTVFELVSEWSFWAELRNDSSSDDTGLAWCHSNQLVSLDDFVDVIVRDNRLCGRILINWIEHKTIVTVCSLPSLESDSKLAVQLEVAHVLLSKLLPKIGIVKDQHIKDRVCNYFDGLILPI